MVQKSHGARKRSRKKMRAEKRVAPSAFLQKFEIGDNVSIDFVPNIRSRGYPYLRFQGRTGCIVEKRGDAYVVQVRDGGMTKKVVVTPVHMRKA